MRNEFEKRKRAQVGEVEHFQRAGFLGRNYPAGDFSERDYNFFGEGFTLEDNQKGRCAEVNLKKQKAMNFRLAPDYSWLGVTVPNCKNEQFLESEEYKELSEICSIVLTSSFEKPLVSYSFIFQSEQVRDELKQSKAVSELKVKIEEWEKDCLLPSTVAEAIQMEKGARLYKEWYEFPCVQVITSALVSVITAVTVTLLSLR